MKMTKEEAIKNLMWVFYKIRVTGSENIYDTPPTEEEIKQAGNMAIEALEQEPVLDKIRAEIEQIIGERNLDDYDFCSGLICARKIIDKYKAGIEPQESEG